MSFDREGLIDACKAHGIVARVVVAATRGSVPREVGAAMLVWTDGMSGTIGGGALEHQAMLAARAKLIVGTHALTHHPLGPALGQCCGGAVDLLTEVYDLQSASALPEQMIARGPGEMPLAVSRIKAAARGQGQLPPPQLIDGWMVESVVAATCDVWIWGAGHVGRAMAHVMDPLPGLQVTIIDTHTWRFPQDLPGGVTRLVAARPEIVVAHAPAAAEHYIVTYSHALDLELCHRLLQHGFNFAGLIGSATKWARFRKRLRELGHSVPQIDRITCPIGRPELGKHPHQIALGVAAVLVDRKNQTNTVLEGLG